MGFKVKPFIDLREKEVCVGRRLVEEQDMPSFVLGYEERQTERGLQVSGSLTGL